MSVINFAFTTISIIVVIYIVIWENINLAAAQTLPENFAQAY